MPRHIPQAPLYVAALGYVPDVSLSPWLRISAKLYSRAPNRERVGPHDVLTELTRVGGHAARAALAGGNPFK